MHWYVQIIHTWKIPDYLKQDDRKRLTGVGMIDNYLQERKIIGWRKI